ncbi:MAG: substrate-binding domain-containing protein, partial [Hyphomicrobiaceae bacterium]
MSEYLTTREVAALLRLKERKVYDLAASGDIPCSRATGKLLFPRSEVEAWLQRNTTGERRSASAAGARPRVFLGSHDPLLEWALRESHADLAMFFDGSLDGLERFARGEGVACGLHICEGKNWNVPMIAERFGQDPVVLVEWAWRRRGLIVRGEDASKIRSLADIVNRRIVPRQEQSGSQILFDQLLSEAGT